MKKRLVRSAFRSLLTALVAGRELAESNIATSQPAASVEAGETVQIPVAAPASVLPAFSPELQPEDKFHVRKGWSVPQPTAIPAPTYVPAMMAFGIVMVALGVVTRWFFVLLGAIVILIAAWQWLEELLGERGAGANLG